MATSKLKLAKPTPAGSVIPISQPSPRSSVTWTPALLRSVLRRADAGDLSLVADLCDQIVADDRFGELLAQLADDVIGCDLSFEASLRSVIGNAEKFYEIAEDWPLGYDDDELKSLLVWTMVTGVGFAKHEAWIETPSGRIVPALKWWHPQHFSYMPRGGTYATAITGDLRNHQWHVREPGTDRWKPIAAGDGEWVIITRRSEYTPWRHGLWRPLAVWWLLKQYAMQDSGVHTEKASKTVVNSNVDSTEAQRREVAQYVYDAAKDAVVVLPDGWTLDIKEIGADLDTLYHSQIRLANESAAVTILGQNLSTNVDGGSYAAAREHGRKENRRVRNAAQMLTKNLQAQSLKWWAEFNFGNKSLAPYPRWHTEPSADFAAKASALQTVATSLLTLKTAGWEIDEETIEEEYGVALKKTKALVAREQAEPGDTDGDGIPHNEPGNPSAPLPGGSDPQKTAPKAAPPRPRPPRPNNTPAVTALASGDNPAEAAGFVRGQIYTDALTDRTTALVAGELSGFLDKITAAIDGAETYEDVRYGVIKAFQGQADPTAMAKIIEHALLLSDLAGRHAVLEDVPEDE